MEQSTLILAIASIIGALLITSAWGKIRDPRAFLKIVGEYPLFARHPGTTSVMTHVIKRGITTAIPWVEVTLGLLLLSSWTGLTRLGFRGALVFVGLATIALAQRAAGGERRIRCGCGGDLDETHSLAFLLLRNCLLLAAMTAGLVFSHAMTSHPPVDQAVSLCAVGFGVVLTLKLLRAAWAARRAANEWRVAG
jgi:hypothetical protein